MAGTILDNNIQKTLRSQGHLHDHEVASVHGDLLIAENVQTGARRVLDIRPMDLNESRRILKG